MNAKLVDPILNGRGPGIRRYSSKFRHRHTREGGYPGIIPYLRKEEGLGMRKVLENFWGHNT